MQLALSDGKVLIRTVPEELPIVKGLPNSKFNKKLKAWEVPATAEMLGRLGKLVALPPTIEQERIRLQRKKEKIDRERLNEKPVPLTDYPVKVSMYAHQMRAANMALIQFELED